MESSILSEVDDTSILRTGLPRRYACPLNWLPASRLLPRAAGWSAATLCHGTDRLCQPVRKHFRCWRLTGYAAAAPVLLSLTRCGPKAVRRRLYSLCCTDQQAVAVSPPQRHLREANVLRPAKLEHAVQR